MAKIIVTGINGFVGHHVTQQLYERGWNILGVGNQPVLGADLEKKVNRYVSCDLTDKKQVAKIDLKNTAAIINLAGFAKVGEPKGHGELYNRVNVGVHSVLYQECLNQGVSPRIIAVSTGAVYDPEQPLPITEESKLIPDEKTNEYVISKKLTEEAVLKFSQQGLRCIIARPFNHTGPGQLPGFLLPDLYEQVKESQASGKALRVGNLETRRDFTDVRDVARAYVDLALAEETDLKHNEYNICSGKSIQGREILRILADACGVSDIKTEADPDRMRKNDVMDIYGSWDRINSDIGWEPTIPIEQTIREFVSQKEN